MIKTEVLASEEERKAERAARRVEEAAKRKEEAVASSKGSQRKSCSSCENDCKIEKEIFRGERIGGTAEEALREAFETSQQAGYQQFNNWIGFSGH